MEAPVRAAWERRRHRPSIQQGSVQTLAAAAGGPHCQASRAMLHRRPTCEAKASLISYTSMSSRDRPAISTCSQKPGQETTAAGWMRMRGMDGGLGWAHGMHSGLGASCERPRQRAVWQPRRCDGRQQQGVPPNTKKQRRPRTAAGMATAGPMPMTAGGTPTAAKLRGGGRGCGEDEAGRVRRGWQLADACPTLVQPSPVAWRSPKRNVLLSQPGSRHTIPTQVALGPPSLPLHLNT